MHHTDKDKFYNKLHDSVTTDKDKFYNKLHDSVTTDKDKFYNKLHDRPNNKGTQHPRPVREALHNSVREALHNSVLCDRL